MNYRTFNQFLQSKVWVEDISKILEVEDLEGMAGWIYLKSYYIVDLSRVEHRRMERFQTHLGNGEVWSDDLNEVEQKLYDYVTVDQDWEPPKMELRIPMDLAKGTQYEMFCETNDLGYKELEKEVIIYFEEGNDLEEFAKWFSAKI